MSNMLKAAALTLAIGAAWPAGNAQAAVVTHELASNSVNYCQAFTPGTSNTVRNRVVGAENVGASPIAVACNFHALFNGTAAGAATQPRQLVMYFSNNNTSGTITITCTMLTGYQTDTSTYVSSKTTTAIPSGGTAQRSLAWAPADNPTAGATTLGNYLIGVNCTLPSGGVINDAYLTWNQDNGIGS